MQNSSPETPNNLVELRFRDEANRLPPQIIEAEESVLGGILLDPGAFLRIDHILEAEAFFINAHKNIYKAALALYGQGLPTDLMSVYVWLVDHELLESVGGQGKLVQLVEHTVSAVNIDRYAALVMDKYRRRQLIQVGHEIVKLGYDLPVPLSEIFGEAEQKLLATTQPEMLGGAAVEPPLDVLLRVFDAATNPEKTKGLMTGLYDLDALMGGLKKKDLYIVAGRSGMGKTHLAVHLAANTLAQGKPVVFFSAEMDRDRLAARFLSWESGVDSQKIINGTVSPKESLLLSEAVQNLGNIPLYLDDTPGSSLTLARIRSGIRRATVRYGEPALVCLDYLQLLGDESSQVNRVSELDKITNGLKVIAREMDVPVVALAQINRGVESRSDKRPLISDLRESGAIEQSADGILLLFRPGYYDTNYPEPNKCEIYLGKNRNGPVGCVKTLVSLETSRFDSIAQSAQERANYDLSHSSHAIQSNAHTDEIEDEF